MYFRVFLENSELNECVVAAVRLDNGVVLAKNRDRGYKANVEVVHELINGTEVMYWRDLDTDWCEGMNEYGIGMVSSSLMVSQVLMDLKNLEVVVRMDRDEGVFSGIVNKLPTGYKSKIKLKIEH